MSHDEVTGEILDHKGRRLDAEGRELPDPSSLAPPIGFIKQPPLHELIRTMVRSEVLAREAAALDSGSFEDEDDFEIGDEEPDPSSPWEENFEGVSGDPPTETTKPITGSPSSAGASSGTEATSEVPAVKVDTPSPGAT